MFTNLECIPYNSMVLNPNLISAKRFELSYTTYKNLEVVLSVKF